MNNFFLKISYKFDILLKLYTLLSYSKKKQFLYMFFLLLIGVFFETLSIGLIIPMLILLTKNNSGDFGFIDNFFNHFPFFNNIYVVLLTVFFVYFMKIIFINYVIDFDLPIYRKK